MSKKQKEPAEKTCVVCDKPVSQWPMCFRGDPTCCENCRKANETGVSKPKKPKKQKKEQVALLGESVEG